VFPVATQDPVDGLHASSVQAFPSLQTTGTPGAQVPDWHESPCVHALPSLQSQSAAQQPATACPATHSRLAQTSPDVQAFPSSHSAVFGAFWQCPETQVSSVQGLASPQEASETQVARTGFRSVLKSCTPAPLLHRLADPKELDVPS
jgi:hypothetical protein